jgi:hypothetical protein
MATGMRELERFVLEGLEQPGEFTPTPYYDDAADVLFFCGKDVPTYAKRLNSLVTLILATSDNSLAGIKLKSVRRLVEKLGAILRHVDAKASLSGGKLKMNVLLSIATSTPPDDPELISYERELSEQFGDIEIDANQLCLA